MTLSPEARALAASDPAMAALIERVGPRTIEDRRRGRGDDPFAALARIIVAQQVSTAAARTIWSRVVEAFGDPPEAARVIGAEDRLRAAGLSGRKSSYVAGVAEAIASGDLDPRTLTEAPDEEVIEAITSLRGLGRWSAEMYLIFHLGRPDVFSPGDLGLRNGIGVALGLEEAPGPEEAARIAERWRPNRTLASIYLWEAVAAPPLRDG